MGLLRLHFHPVRVHRLMVGCSYSPDSPGEARFHVMDEQPPLPLTEPTPVAIAVQLRIAKGDFSFQDYIALSYQVECFFPPLNTLLVFFSLQMRLSPAITPRLTSLSASCKADQFMWRLAWRTPQSPPLCCWFTPAWRTLKLHFPVAC